MKINVLTSLKFAIFALLSLSFINAFLKIIENNFVTVIILTLILTVLYMIAEIYEKGLHRSIKTYNWSETEGIVLEHVIKKEEHMGELRLIPVIKYKYKVDNNTYNSENYSFDDVYFYSEFEIKNFFELKPINSLVAVYYNPYNVKSSILEKGSVDFVKRTAITSILILMIGLVYILKDII